MQISKLILALVIFSACATVTVKAQNTYFDSIYDIFREKVEQQLQKYLENQEAGPINQMQLKFIQQFIKSIVLGEIKLYDWALNQKNEISKQDQQKIKEEVDALVEAIFQERYTNLQQLINDIKKESPKELGNLFSEDTFSKDITVVANQEKLVNAIIKKLFEEYKAKESLVVTLKDLDSLKKFLIKYKGINESDIDASIEYLKDARKIKKSMETLISNLKDEKIRQKLITLSIKLIQADLKSSDILEIFYNDPELASILLDNDWESLLKIKDQLYAVGGKAYEQYQKTKSDQEKEAEKQKEAEEELDDEDDEDDKAAASTFSTGKIILVLAAIAFIIGLVFVGMRRYRQTKLNSVGFHDDRYYVNSTL